MKKFIIFFSLLAFPFFLAAQGSDEYAIKKVIQEAYVDGLQNKGDLQKTKDGFHPDFNLLGLKNDALTKLPIDKWIVYAEKAKERNPGPPPADKIVRVEFVNIDITGSAACAKIELYKNKKKIFTDYLSLYKFSDGWKIVSKIYYRH